MNKEQKIFVDLKQWVYNKYPRVYLTLMHTTDTEKRREMSRELLKFRLKKEPGLIIELTDKIFSKLNMEYEANPKIIDPKIVKLTKETGGQVIAKINGKIPITQVDFISMNRRKKNGK